MEWVTRVVVHALKTEYINMFYKAFSIHNSINVYVPIKISPVHVFAQLNPEICQVMAWRRSGIR